MRFLVSVILRIDKCALREGAGMPPYACRTTVVDVHDPHTFELVLQRTLDNMVRDFWNEFKGLATPISHSVNKL